MKLQHKLRSIDNPHATMTVDDDNWHDGLLQHWTIEASRHVPETDAQAGNLAESETVIVAIPGQFIGYTQVTLPKGTPRREAKAMIQRWRQTAQFFGRCNYGTDWKPYGQPE